MLSIIQRELKNEDQGLLGKGSSLALQVKPKEKSWEISFSWWFSSNIL